MRWAVLALPVTLALAGWKVVLFVLSPSTALLANVVVNLGLAIAKFLTIRAHRFPGDGSDDAVLRVQRRAYRTSGWLILGLALAYVASGLPSLSGRDVHPYDKWVAIGIATVAFTELALALVGVLSARRRKSLLVEAVKFTNLACAATLLVLTQTALLSMRGGAGTATYNGLAGVVLGSAAALVGLHMVLRVRDPRATPVTQQLNRASTPAVPRTVAPHPSGRAG